MKYDIAILGGGTAGLVTASGCARLGRRVALIEKDALGGDCLWTGCVPTKALVASARVAWQAAHADAYGFTPHAFAVDPARVLESMRETQRITAVHDDPEKFRKLGIDVVFGEAAFTSPHTIRAGGREIAAKQFVIATGSRTRVPMVPGLAETGFIDHASFLRQSSIPSSIVILGGGAIGIEFAQMLRRLGSTVTVIEADADILGREERDAVSVIREALAGEGIAIRTATKATAVRVENGRRIVTIDSARGRDEVTADEIFVATGRRGNIEGLNLETIGVWSDRGYVTVDEYLRTSVKHIWACGDVHGGPQFTHVAAYEAVKLVRNMLFPGTSAVDYSNIPVAIYTDPEIARVGMTEGEAIAQRGAGNVKSWHVAMADVDRAVIDRTTRGFVKIITDRRGRILGGHVVGPHASSLVQQIVMARSGGMTIRDLAQTTSAYPSLADALQKAGALYFQDVAKGWLGKIARKLAR